jgi:hypothetical protein
MFAGAMAQIGLRLTAVAGSMEDSKFAAGRISLRFAVL